MLMTAKDVITVKDVPVMTVKDVNDAYDGQRCDWQLKMLSVVNDVTDS